MSAQPMRCRLLCELERAPATYRGLAERLDANARTVRTRLTELRELGVVAVVAVKPQRGQAANVYGIAIAKGEKE